MNAKEELFKKILCLDMLEARINDTQYVVVKKPKAGSPAVIELCYTLDQARNVAKTEELIWAYIFDMKSTRHSQIYVYDDKARYYTFDITIQKDTTAVETYYHQVLQTYEMRHYFSENLQFDAAVIYCIDGQQTEEA